MAHHEGHGGILILGLGLVGIYGYFEGWFSGLFGTAAPVAGPQLPAPTVPVNSSGIPTSCPTGWALYNGSCFPPPTPIGPIGPTIGGGSVCAMAPSFPGCPGASNAPPMFVPPVVIGQPQTLYANPTALQPVASSDPVFQPGSVIVPRGGTGGSGAGVSGLYGSYHFRGRG